MKEKTVVINSTNDGTKWTPQSLEKQVGSEVTALLGDILLDHDKEYCITRNAEGRLSAVFYDTAPESEEWTAKVTMTALKPSQKFQIRYWNRIAGLLSEAEAKTLYRKANSAGVFEAKLPLEGADLLLIQEIE